MLVYTSSILKKAAPVWLDMFLVCRYIHIQKDEHLFFFAMEGV
jgi:hypothetical protein